MASQMSQVPQQHIPSLNGLRALSVLLVAASHAGFGRLVPGGLGVTVFFFLSGFLITMILRDEFATRGTIDFRNFYIRRLFRLTPPFLATLALGVVMVMVHLLPGYLTPKALLAQVFYLANYYSIFWDPGHTIVSGTEVFWSLAVEEHFYFVYPVVLLALLRHASNRTAQAAMWIVCGAVLAWRYGLVLGNGFVPERTAYATDTRIDSILYGCVFALATGATRLQNLPAISSRFATACLGVGAGLLLLTVVVRDPVFRETWRYSIQGVALMPIFFSILSYRQGWLHGLLNLRWMEKLGEYSYAFYLVHFIIAKSLLFWGVPDGSVALYALVVVLSAGYAKGLNVCLERPMKSSMKNLLAVAPALASKV
jgi:peptidoglycan/LPS O-acetylase OafA/YrhL